MEDNSAKNNNIEEDKEKVCEDCKENMDNNEDVIEENKAEVEEDLEKVIDEVKKDNKNLANENKKFQNEINVLKDRLSRIVSEYDNFRKRTSKEKEGIYTDACGDILKEMLPVLDNLERAITVEGNVEDLKQGVEMTIKQFKDSLNKLNVEEISTDCEFDPNVHNAVMHVEDEQYGKNQVVEVLQKGYKRGEKVLRYSMVKVAN